MRPSAVFAPDLLAVGIAIVTGGGTNLGRAAAAELIACGADAVISRAAATRCSSRSVPSWVRAATGSPATSARWRTASKYPDELTRGLARFVPMGRCGEPREFGRLAALVASPLGTRP